jgi:DNA-binding HxlR family transcriptional regulator
VRYGILARHAYAEVPPRVEYRLTPFGQKFAQIIDSVAQLQRDLESEA